MVAPAHPVYVILNLMNSIPKTGGAIGLLGKSCQADPRPADVQQAVYVGQIGY
jgi:hypothetical protein